ncbi:malate dehydrogenase-like isoform X2 [Sitodiplosis mosellana]|nr:malate dehydrogenase-like isoform X2 [Sitodiplosis mosellana]
MSLLLKENTLISELALWGDARGGIGKIPGIAADLSHISTPVKVLGYSGPGNISAALQNADVVVIPAGVARKKGMSRQELFKANAEILRDIAVKISTVCPKALIAIITNPVNSGVPVVSEVLKKQGTYDPNRIFGVTTLDIVRAQTFIGDEMNVSPLEVNVPVIGGHSDESIIPVLSQTHLNSVPKKALTLPKFEELTKRIQVAGSEIVTAKNGDGSATLSTAYAATRFVNALVEALTGDPNVFEYAYVRSNVTTAKYFSTRLKLGKNGIEKIFGIPELNEFEKKLLHEAIPLLQKDIEAGEKYVKEEQITTKNLQ